MSGPRMKGGGPLRHLGRGFYVLINWAGEEVSERRCGEAWLGMERLGATVAGETHLRVFIIPDETNRESRVVLTATGAVAGVATCLAPDGVVTTSAIHAAEGHEVHIDWTGQLEALA